MADGTNDIQRFERPYNIGHAFTFKLYIGGKIPHQPHASVNGQIANIGVRIGPGGFVSDYNMWKKHLVNRCPHPLPDDETLKMVEIVGEE